MYIEPNKEKIKKVSDKSWRLIYNGINIMELAEQDFEISVGGDTQLFVVDTKEKCLIEIERLGLIFPKHLK